MQTLEVEEQRNGDAARYADYESFVDAAMRTDIPDYAPVVARMTPEMCADLSQLMCRAIWIADDLDRVKKHLFYGKDYFNSGLRIPLSQQSEKVMRLLHAAIGINTESGEILKQMYDHMFLGKPLDEVNLLEEFGDVSWYQRYGLRALGFKLLDMFKRNVAKLFKRFPERFTEHHALNRDLESERKELEAQ